MTCCRMPNGDRLACDPKSSAGCGCQCHWQTSPAYEPSSSAWCCCLGVIGNTHYKCLARALDLGHCRPDECPTYDECRARIASMATGGNAPSRMDKIAERVPDDVEDYL